MRDFVVKPLRKGVPSLFRNLKALYADPAKAAEMGKAFAEIEQSLASSKKFPGASEAEAKPDECRVYALTLLAGDVHSHDAFSLNLRLDRGKYVLLIGCER